jgi:hypothetical protein
MMKEYYKAGELAAPIYKQEGYELRQILEDGNYAIFRNYKEDGEKVFYVVDDDWGIGNIDDEGIFHYRVENLKEELRVLAKEYELYG